MPDRRIRRRQAAAMPKTGTWNTLREICNRNFNVVTLINLLIMTAYYLIFVTSTAYARQTYTSSLSTAGFTAGIMVIGCLAGRFVTGNLLSFFGCRTVLFAGLVLCAGSIAGFFAVVPCRCFFCSGSARDSASALPARPQGPLWPMWSRNDVTGWA